MRPTGSTRSVLLALCVVAAAVIPPAASGEDRIVSGDLETLQQRLEPLGWRVERSPDGDLLLWPATRTPAATAPAEDGKTTIPQQDLATLQARLEERGWRVERDADGSLLLYPKDGGGVTAAGERVAPLDDVRALLLASGWTVEKKEGGDLLLFPGTSPGVPVEKTLDKRVRQDDLAAVRQAVEQSGWRTERRPDGSLVLYPRDAAGVPPESSATEPTLAEQAGVKLPVDTWGEAQRIARRWVQQQQGRLTVGRIRKVNWIYLVSIVDSKPPYRLKNQLVIRSQDGRVIPLY
ncbi:MAG TPA: hypothetical protein ENI96_05975 [Sedimenticola thiotaurini]|uniref:PepSY domain-containing protein n=1 Tax=Sedimenticola thiotaurini TaxID=1543721 RepID=A0A831WAC1_9GAMM|nr:hypothetical protein [Sedimenticola thiotaurini]